MKLKTLNILFGMFFLFAVQQAYAINSTRLQQSNKIYLQEQFGVSSVQDFLLVKAKDIKAHRGKRLSIKERIALKLVKQNIKKQLNKKKDVDVKTTYNDTIKGAGHIGFFLGLLLGLLGVAIAYTIGKDVGRASWGGFAALVLALLVIFIL